MKKYYLPVLLLLATLAGCSDNNNDSDINDLKARVEALEKTKSVIGITFSGTQMVLNYSTSETQTLDMPSGLNGLNGTNGTDGNGIKTIAFDETTNLLTIVLTNGNESKFKIITNSDKQLAAVLISDVNGSMYVSEVTMGAVPLATITYDANFNITSMISKAVVDGKIMNYFDVTKQYTNNLLTNVKTQNYATEKEVMYDTENFENNVTTETKATVVIESKDSYLDTYKTLNQTEANQDGTYTYYRFQGNYESHNYVWNTEKNLYIHTYTNVNYNKYPNAIKKSYTEYPNNLGYYFETIDNSNVNKYTLIDDNYYWEADITKAEFWYYKSAKYTKTGIYNIGDIRSTKNHQIECNAAGNPLKIYETTQGATSANRYVQLTYNTAGFVTRSDEYNKVGETWIANPIYLTFEYNTSNLLTSVKRNYADGKNEEVYKNVYDKNGNPVEIYAWGSEITLNNGYYYYNYYNSGYFDPFEHPENPYSYVSVPEGLQLVAKVEYDYSCKNFFGNTIGAILPELNNYKIFNAPVKISKTQSVDYSWIEYSGYNDSGYPEIMTVNAYDENSNSYRLQFNVTYIKK